MTMTKLNAIPNLKFLITTNKLNDTPLVYRQEFQKEYPKMESWYIKNWHWEKVTKQMVNSYIWDVLRTMYDNCLGRYRYLFVDIKVQDLVVGRNTANGHWHLDSSLLPDFAYDNQIFVNGFNRTEFVTTPLDIPDVKTSKEFDSYIRKQPDLGVVMIPDCTIVHYNGRNVHRGVMVTQPETRLLIRMINTNKQLPQSSGGV